MEMHEDSCKPLKLFFFGLPDNPFNHYMAPIKVKGFHLFRRTVLNMASNWAPNFLISLAHPNREWEQKLSKADCPFNGHMLYRVHINFLKRISSSCKVLNHFSSELKKKKKHFLAFLRFFSPKVFPYGP